MKKKKERKIKIRYEEAYYLAWHSFFSDESGYYGPSAMDCVPRAFQSMATGVQLELIIEVMKDWKENDNEFLYYAPKKPKTCIRRKRKNNREVKISYDAAYDLAWYGYASIVIGSYISDSVDCIQDVFDSMAPSVKKEFTKKVQRSFARMEE